MNRKTIFALLWLCAWLLIAYFIYRAGRPGIALAFAVISIGLTAWELTRARKR